MRLRSCATWLNGGLRSCTALAIGVACLRCAAPDLTCCRRAALQVSRGLLETSSPGLACALACALWCCAHRCCALWCCWSRAARAFCALWCSVGLACHTWIRAALALMHALQRCAPGFTPGFTPGFGLERCLERSAPGRTRPPPLQCARCCPGGRSAPTVGSTSADALWLPLPADWPLRLAGG